MVKTCWKEEVVYQICPRSFQDTNPDGVSDFKGIVQLHDEIIIAIDKIIRLIQGFSKGTS